MSAASPWSATSVLSSPTALPHTLQSLLKALGNNFPADGIFVNTYYSETKEVHFLAHATHQSAQEIYDIVPLDRNRKSNAQTPSQDPVYRVDNIETDPFTHAVATQVIADIQSYVMVRLRLEGRHLGVACFYSRRQAALTTLTFDKSKSCATCCRCRLALHCPHALTGETANSNQSTNG